MSLFEIAVAAPLPGTLSYASPENGENYVAPGVRVLVPLGKRLLTGYVLGPAEANDSISHAIKPIAEILDPLPLFPAGLIPFFRWVAQYYHFPLGEVIKTALPSGLTATSGKRLHVTAEGLSALPNLGEKEKEILGAELDTLLIKGGLPALSVQRLWRKPASQRLLRRLTEKGLLRMETVVSGQTVREKSVILARLSDQYHQRIAAANPPALGLAEQRIIDLLANPPDNRNTLEQAEICRHCRTTPAVLRRLKGKSLVVLEQRPMYRDPFGREPPFFSRPDRLTTPQRAVLDRLLPVISRPSFQSYLLHGVTGSGKTEVYLRATEEALGQSRTALILVPEIALASQLEGQFYSRFGARLAVLHSGLGEGEKLDQWLRIIRKEVQVVVGARSAVFAPLDDLGLVIVDEEHEAAYKQDTGLCYNGRDLAILRARFADCPVLLGSATPALTSYHQALSGRHELLRMDQRIADQVMPKVEVVNLRRTQRSRPDLFLTDQLISEIRRNLEENQQSLLFVNRRGFASFVMCRDCGSIVQCRNCQVSLTKHRHNNQLLCHYCGYTLPGNLLCPACQSTHLGEMGLGSERVEKEVQELFPEARVARLDSDTAGGGKQYLHILSLVREGKVDILVGTQMIAKGLHFPRVTLVGVVWADSGLAMPDYKASERTFQILAQVTGRAGRGEHPGRVVIQTHQPDHHAVVCAREHAYETFHQMECSQRSLLGYPPFGRLIILRFKGSDETQVGRAAQNTADFLQHEIDEKGWQVSILGPAPAPLARIRNKTRWQMLLKSNVPRLLHHLCEILQERQKDLVPRAVQLQIDVDPENMM